MSEQKPRVTASRTIEAITEGQLCQRFVHTTPNVHVSVGFDLHDHEAALAALEAAVADVRSQIEETKMTTFRWAIPKVPSADHVMGDLTDHGWAYSPGGPVAGHGEQRGTVERAGTCPNGHPWYRIGGSPYVEHISGPGDTYVIFCRYAATYQPKEAATTPDSSTSAPLTAQEPSEAPEDGEGAERPTAANLGPQDQTRVDVVIRDVYAVREPDGFLRINVGPATALIDPDAKNVTVTSRIEREADNARD